MATIGLTHTDIQKAIKIRKAVNEYFKTSNVSKVQAKELMSLFISKGIFTHDEKDGLPIRNFLRFLDENQQLSLIPQVLAERKDKYTYWYFIKSDDKCQ